MMKKFRKVLENLFLTNKILIAILVLWGAIFIASCVKITVDDGWKYPENQYQTLEEEAAEIKNETKSIIRAENSTMLNPITIKITKKGEIKRNFENKIYILEKIGYIFLLSFFISAGIMLSPLVILAILIFMGAFISSIFENVAEQSKKILTKK